MKGTEERDIKKMLRQAGLSDSKASIVLRDLKDLGNESLELLFWAISKHIINLPE